MRSLTIDRFNGGLLNQDAVGVGKETLNVIRYGSNIRTRSGSVVSRAGLVDYCDLSAFVGIMGNSINALYEYSREAYSGGDTTIWHAILFTVGTQLYYIVPTDSTTIAIAVSPTLTSGDIYGTTAFDHFFFGTGRDNVMVFDGSSVLRNAGIDRPDDLTLNANNNAGARSRTYKYTYYRSANPMDIESIDSYGLTIPNIDHTDPDVDLNYHQADDAQVNYYKFWATEFWDPSTEDEPTNFYLLETVSLAQGVAASHIYTDTALDVALVENTAYDTTDRSIPSQVKYLLWHDNRLFGAGEIANPSVIYYSIIGNPFYWPIANWDEISRDDGEVITGLGSIASTRYIFKSTSIWEWTGDPENVTPIRAVERPNATMNQTRVAVGCEDPRSLSGWGSSLIFRARDGHVYMLTVDSLIQLSQYVKTDIQVLGITKAAVYDDYYIITDGTTTMVCDLQRGKFGWEGFDGVGGTGVVPACFLVDHHGYLLGSEDDKIIRYYTGTQDNGVDIMHRVQSAWVRTKGLSKVGIMRRLHIGRRTNAADFVVYLRNQRSVLLDTGTYLTSERHHSFPKGCRTEYASVLLLWIGTDAIDTVTFEWLLGKRH